MSHVEWPQLVLELSATWRVVVIPVPRDSTHHIVVSILGILARVTTALMCKLMSKLKAC